MGAGADGAGRSGMSEPNINTFLCCSYNAAAKLAHTPAGAPAGVGVYTVALDTDSGRLRAVDATEAGPNPAFVVRHPSLPVCYVSTERIDADGEVLAYALEPQGLRLLSKRSAVRARRPGTGPAAVWPRVAERSRVARSAASRRASCWCTRRCATCSRSTTGALAVGTWRRESLGAARLAPGAR